MKHSRESLLEHLAEQRDFLDVACDAYDNGRTAMAKVIAVHLRTLVHQTPSSQALLQQLGVLDDLEVPDRTGGKHLDENTIFAVSLVSMSFAETGLIYRPAWTSEETPTSPFFVWWTNNVMKTERFWSRRDIVLGMANKDGGAHVQEALSGPWLAVTRESLWESHGEGPLVSPVNPFLPAVRTIAGELMYALDHQVRDLLA